MIIEMKEIDYFGVKLKYVEDKDWKCNIGGRDVVVLVISMGSMMIADILIRNIGWFL